MPSFDVISEVNMHEATNAVDQAKREVSTRFDFKGSGAHFEQNDAVVTLHAESEFQLRQMLDILQNKLTKRGVDIACLKIDEPSASGRQTVQMVTLRQGLDTPLAKKILIIPDFGEAIMALYKSTSYTGHQRCLWANTGNSYTSKVL